MSGVWEGIEILDLSTGIAGPMSGMLFADHGARVIKIEQPGGDPFSGSPGYRTWMRGRERAEIDLTTEAGRNALHRLASRADVVIESFRPGVAARLGVDHDTLRALNPGLVHCSITGYGRGSRHEDRPAYDALVAARLGLQWEQRGWVGGEINRLCGREPNLPDLDVPDGCAEGAQREGPLFSHSSWPSLAAAFLATTAISAALLAREHTGRGQHVETSLLQGVLATTIAGWQRCDRPDAPYYQTWVTDPRATKGVFQCADGRWIHHWVPNPAFVLGVSGGDEIVVGADVNSPRQDPTRISTNPEEIIVLHHYYPLLAEAFRKFPSDQWVAAGAEVGVALQPIRSPEEALADPALLVEGCVVEVDHPELGTVRQVGIVLNLAATPGSVAAPPVAIGADTERILAEAATATAAAARVGDDPSRAHPLAGIRVLDLGLAVAGPFSTQVLSDLGADVIKINTLWDGFWHANHIAFACNRGKRSLSVDLKQPQGMELIRRLVAGADVVQHNMRYSAAERLGVDYESLRQINPALVYCHSRGHDRGPRGEMAGNDQTGSALAGVEFEDGGGADGGRPMWSLASMGDTGNGFLAAIGIIQALYHRDRTGVGQFVDTSILNACLLNVSTATLDADGVGLPRPRLDSQQFGLHPLYRLYPTSDGWLCIAAITDRHWSNLRSVLSPSALDAFAGAVHDGGDIEGLGDILARVFMEKSASQWFDVLDGGGVPCEVSSPDFALSVFDDPELIARQWVTSYDHPVVGHLDQFGLLFDLSDTPARIAGPPLTVGGDTRQILRDLGLDDAEIDRLVADKVVLDAS